MATSLTGGLTLPIPAGVANSALNDPTVDGLLAYLAHCLRADLDAKLANIGGMSATAIATGATYPWDPDTHFVRKSIPALYLFWPGTSKILDETVSYVRRERPLIACYVYDEHVMPNGLLARAGLLAAVDASFAKAAERGRHATHTPSGSVPGGSVRNALGLLGWGYDGAQRGEMAAAIPSTSSTPGGPPEGNVKRGYPCLRAQFTVWERIYDDTSQDPADVTRDILANIEMSELDDQNDTLVIQQGYLVAPDGSEIPEESDE
jgi:hypothetical protein